MAMRTELPHRKCKVTRSVFSIGLLVALAVGVTGREGVAGEAPRALNPATSSSWAASGPTDDISDMAMWDEIDELIEQQQYRAAEAKVEQRLEEAMAVGDDADWTRSLIRLVQLQTALHGYETAVRTLQDRLWPDDDLDTVVLRLFYAQGLVHYIRAYSWEIRAREQVVSSASVDLHRLTLEQIRSIAEEAYLAVWTRRGSLDDRPLEDLGEYLDPNNYPPRIRGSLRDAVTYLWVELLSDTSLWRPRELSEVDLLDLEAILQDRSDEATEAVLADASTHPLVKLGLLLDDLEAWHHRAGRPEAAAEARFEKYRRLFQSLEQQEDRARIEEELASFLAQLDHNLGWWSVGQFELAQMVSQGSEDDALIRARDLAWQGLQANPGTLGADLCQRLIEIIETPEFNLSAMRTDGLDRRSIDVRHKNLRRLYFRAYAIDVRDRIATSSDYDLLPGYREISEILRSQDYEAAWVTDLPETPDFRSHRSPVTPALSQPGLYLIVASSNGEFRPDSTSEAEIEALYFQVSDLVLLTRDAPRGFEVEVRSGGSGQALEGVMVELYRLDYRHGHQKVEQQSTGVDGGVRFNVGDSRDRRYFLVASLADDLVLDSDQLRVVPQRGPTKTTSSLIYTDRSVYRPGQALSWKIVAYQGIARQGRFATLAGWTVTVSLFDANGEVVESVEATTNGFGSASGRFEIPRGRMLGSWTLQSSIQGYAAIRVEEYKRPSFEVELDSPSQDLRLNREARVGGRARYYFGLPVTEGVVRWSVERVPQYPPWWDWWLGSRPPAGSQMVASGIAQVDSEGLFGFSFVPRADEREAELEGLIYSYRIRAEVTDGGGETRVAERAIRLGFVGVAAHIDSDTSFFSAETRPHFTILRTDLDGLPRRGAGAWNLVRLRQPFEVLLPAEQPLPEPAAGTATFETPGDRLRPRWDPGYEPGRILRMWPDGDELAQGELRHDDSGIAEVETVTLAPGAYRLRYRTQDSFGAVFETQHEFVVAGASRLPLALPGLLQPERSSVGVGQNARILVHTALDHPQVDVELFREGRVFKHLRLENEAANQVLEIPVDEGMRGGFGIRMTLLRDHQLILLTQSVMVPWDDRRLELSFSSFRDRIRPGQREKWRVTVEGTDGRSVDSEATELLAYMYDRSLDLFAPHEPPAIEALYPSTVRFDRLSTNLGMSHAVWVESGPRVSPMQVRLHGDRLTFFDGYPIGGLGRGGKVSPVYMTRSMAIATEAGFESKIASDQAARPEARPQEGAVPPSPPTAETEVSLRTDFAETAFWKPHLVLDESGSVAFEFTVPDSVTAWNVWVHALTTDLRGGSVQRQTQSVKDLMVRPYLPRFLREGDRVQLRVAVNNAAERRLDGVFDMAIEDPETGSSLLAEFGLTPMQARSVPFSVDAGGAQILTFDIDVPMRLGAVAIEVRAQAGDVGDGEAHLVPLLPGRLHLSQSRFATLHDGDRRSLDFEELQTDADASIRHEQLVVTLDAQLFYGVLKALPYLVDFPYECTEQTLNRFLSTGIVSSLYDSYPGVAAMAEAFSQRDTRTESWDRSDPNLAMSLEETPWLTASRGGDGPNEDLINVLDPTVARAELKTSIAKLQQAQTSSGGFPWWPGGPPSPYMTVYLLHGLSRALEFGIQVPKPMVVDAWRYLHSHFVGEIADRLPASDCCWQMVTFLNYVLSAYADASWTGNVFSDEDRRIMLDHSFRHWQEHSPLLKSYLSLTLARADRLADARLVFASVMDSAKSSRDEGVFWAPEDRAWLWYNDTIETHAFALRTLLELDPSDERRHGLVQWLFLNKKLNHWKSTRATAEVVYALVKYLEQEDNLAVEERAVVDVAGQTHTFVFAPDVYTGADNQIVLGSEELEAAVAEGFREIVVEKETPGFLFASATWHFSTERLPQEAHGDLFAVERKFFKRQATEEGFTLQPIGSGSRIELGDQIEVQLVLRARSEAEYVHLRDPRGAGFEPDSVKSGYRWDLGIVWYEEIRDSGTNFFIEHLPVGEFTLRYRLRAATAGFFRTGPTVVQSMYAPEFSAYSSGSELEIEP